MDVRVIGFTKRIGDSGIGKGRDPAESFAR